MGKQVAPDARLRVALVCGPEIMRLGLERLLAHDAVFAVRAYRRLHAAREPADAAVVCDRDVADAAAVCAAACARLDAGVVLVTARSDPHPVLDCLAAGATGLVAEADSADHLPAAVRAAARGEYHLGPRLLTVLLDWERSGRRRASSTADAERRLLALLAGGRTTAEIAAALGVTPKTVRNRSSLLYRRLGVRSRAQAVRTAEARGLLDAPRGG
jgi:DNA-binding NarL/FixJ family response regulator